MSWKDYETLDATKETATAEELKEFRRKYNLPVNGKRREASICATMNEKSNSLKKKES